MNALEAKIKLILEEKVSPELALHGGSVSFISVDEAGEVVKVSFHGVCKTCPSAQMTLESIVTEQLRVSVPTLKEVILVNETHQDMLDFAKNLMKKG
jgi:Fe-S cluster biogenesis protein NfuA